MSWLNIILVGLDIFMIDIFMIAFVSVIGGQTLRNAHLSGRVKTKIAGLFLFSGALAAFSLVNILWLQ